MNLYRSIFLLPLLLVIALTAGCTGKGKRLKVGDPAPLFSAVDVNGNSISLAALKGKPVVLRFFEPDCRYCKADTAVFSRYYQQYQDKGLEIIYVDVSPDTNLVKSFIKELKIRFPVIQDGKGKIAAKYLVKVVPQAIVLSPDLKIEGAMMGGVSESELKHLLAKYIP
ncbi:MAG: TlpA disulfide reductase family protein [Deltaproteobacteria bacterium]